MIYGFFSTVFFIIILPFWLIAGVFNPKLTAGFAEKCLGGGKCWGKCWGKFRAKYGEKYTFTKTRAGKTIIFYGISVGEVTAMENLIKKTREIFPGTNIAVMTGTKTGREIAEKKLDGIADLITYFPFDFPFCIKNMLKNIEPDAVFIMETELWPNFAYIADKKKIPVYIINARISDKTYKSYKKLSFFFAPVLKKYAAVYPQSERDKEKLISIGANPQTTKIMGNLKFDIKKPDISNLDFGKNPQYKVIIAGSTHSGEDEIILNSFKELKKEIPDLKLMIAPRHPERNERVFDLMKKTGFSCSKRSKVSGFEENDIILLDVMGELGKFYSVCDAALIGGSFSQKGKGVGGHNPLEAVIFGKPVISGPSIHNFKDIYTVLTSTNAGKIVKDGEELQEHLKKLLTNEIFYKKASKDCENIFEQNKGALNFVINVLQSIV